MGMVYCRNVSRVRESCGKFKSQVKTNMSTFFKTFFFRKKYVFGVVSQSAERLVTEGKGLQNYLRFPFYFQSRSLDSILYNQRSRNEESHRTKQWWKYPHILAVFGAALDNKSREKQATTGEPNGEKTPERNRFNERDLTGRFANLSRKTKITKSLNDGLKAWKAKRKLFLDKTNENEPPLKRQTRSEKVKHKQG